MVTNWLRRVMVKPAHLYFRCAFLCPIIKNTDDYAVQIISMLIYYNLKECNAMSWKRIKAPIFGLPTRQEVRIIAASLLMSLIVVTYFYLRT